MSAAGIMRMLVNEKYKGDAVLHKTYSKFMVEGRVKNKGQARMYEVEKSHPPIITSDLYDKVQAELKRRTDLAADGERTGGKYSSRHVFSGKIKCGCGEILRRHGHNYNGEYIPLWLCKQKQLTKGESCQQPHIKEIDIKQAFVRTLNKLIGSRDEFIADFMETANQTITDTDQAAYDVKEAELSRAREEMLELNRVHARQAIASNEYYEASLVLMDRIDALVEKTKVIHDTINTKKQLSIA